MGKTAKQSLGRRGEQMAETYLKERGFRTVKRNYRYGHGEIDLIVHDGEVLAFVEVKSFQAKPLDLPASRVHKAQQKKLIETAYAFLAENSEFANFNVRFDVIIVDFSVYPAQITHYPAAFWLEEPFF